MSRHTLAAALALAFAHVAFADSQRGLDPADAEYLRGVAADTWACIAYFVEPSTGLPFDTSDRPEYTSVTNIGFYTASCGVAAKMKLVSDDEAATRVRRVLAACAKFRTWKGFSQSWNHVRTLAPSPDDKMISVLDSANLLAGLIVAGEALPAVHEEIAARLKDMEWAAFYDAPNQQIYGGYNLPKGEIDKNWHLSDYASDGRMAAFWSIACGAAPPAVWEKLNRPAEEHYGLSILRPAWMGGGLFMQVQHGLFLDERTTPIGRSAANFAYAQMVYAAGLKLPAWGWSACWSPDNRYLGWGGLEVPVVTPHAAGMAAMYYPHKAAECLRRFEALGAREPFTENGQSHRLGFRDSVNLDTKAVCKRYVGPLDQGMMFLALANVLEDGLVQRLFQNHPTVQQGRKLLAEYAAPLDDAWLAELRRRDAAPLPEISAASATGPAEVLIDDFESPDIARNRLGGETTTWSRDAADATVSFKIARSDAERDGKKSACLTIAYDVDSPNAAFGGINFALQHTNGAGCAALEFLARGEPESVKVELHGKGGIGVARARGIRPDAWSRIRITYPQFGGLITDWTDLERLVLVIEDSAAKPKTGTLTLDDIRLTR